MRFVTTMRNIFRKDSKTENKLNKKGFTLVELMICIAIMAVISLLVAQFVTSATGAYRRISSKTKIQEVCQDSLNQISNIVRNSKNLVITKTYDGEIIMESVNYSNNNIRLVYVPSEEADGYGKIFVDYEHDETEGDITIIDSDEQYNEYLLTDMVKDFSIDYSKYVKKDSDGNEVEVIQERVVDLKLTLERNKQEFSRTVKASLRNSSPEGKTSELTITIQG